MLTFKCVSFDGLSNQELYELLKLRAEVFVVEQNCVYLDLDGKDQHGHHLLGLDSQRQLLAYARLLPKGASYPDYASIGRVVTAASLRGSGAGKALMQYALERASAMYENTALKISAQAHLEPFYRELGFLPQGEGYLEDGIPHLAMVRE
ncbi:MAG: GNAT family N-acetyltransferase [Pseudomonadales bacterium]